LHGSPVWIRTGMAISPGENSWPVSGSEQVRRPHVTTPPHSVPPRDEAVAPDPEAVPAPSKGKTDNTMAPHHLVARPSRVNGGHNSSRVEVTHNVMTTVVADQEPSRGSGDRKSRDSADPRPSRGSGDHKSRDSADPRPSRGSGDHKSRDSADRKDRSGHPREAAKAEEPRPTADRRFIA